MFLETSSHLPSPPPPAPRALSKGSGTIWYSVNITIVLLGQINVTLAVFSGRRDPQWFLLPSNSKFVQIKKLLDEARKSYLTYSPNMMPARLGFKGFLVQELKQKEPELIIGKSTLALQQHLFGTLPTGRVT